MVVPPSPPAESTARASSSSCRAHELNIQEVKNIWRPPAGFCGAAVTESHCIWDSVEKVWPTVKHDAAKYCRSSQHVGFHLRRGLQSLGLPADEAYVFFPRWIFENHAASEPVLVLTPCGMDTKSQKQAPSESLLKTLKLVQCRVQ